MSGGDTRGEVSAYWDEQAASFDDAPDHGLREPAIRAAWTELLLPVMPPAPARVADLGCGTGSLAVLLAVAGHRVSGLDLAPLMVERARAKARAAAGNSGWRRRARVNSAAAAAGFPPSPKTSPRM